MRWGEAQILGQFEHENQTEKKTNNDAQTKPLQNIRIRSPIQIKICWKEMFGEQRWEKIHLQQCIDGNLLFFAFETQKKIVFFAA